jgi:hypothetical protein
MEFSELSLKKCKIYPSVVKMTYDSRHTVWVETYLIQSDIKLSENGRVDRNERARMEVHSAIFGQMGFSDKCTIRPNELFGQMGFQPNTFFGLMGFGQTGFQPIEVGSNFDDSILVETVDQNSRKLFFMEEPFYFLLVSSNLP